MDKTGDVVQFHDIGSSPFSRLVTVRHVILLCCEQTVIHQSSRPGGATTQQQLQTEIVSQWRQCIQDYYVIFCGGFGKSSESFLQLLRPPPDPRDALDTQLEKDRMLFRVQ